jgi:hypothetical protein
VRSSRSWRISSALSTELFTGSPRRGRTLATHSCTVGFWECG